MTELYSELSRAADAAALREWSKALREAAVKVPSAIASPEKMIEYAELLERAANRFAPPARELEGPEGAIY